MSGLAWPSVAIGALAATALLLAGWIAVRHRRARTRGRAGERDDVQAAMRALEASRELEASDRGASAATLLRDTLDEVTARLEEVQLPLHILLASPFGELNENQEEMLDAAHTAADAADQRVRQLRKLIALDADGGPPPRPQPTALRELLRAPLAIAEARAAAARVVLRVTLAEAPRRVLADPTQTQEALTALLADAVANAPAGGEVVVDAGDDDAGGSRIVVGAGGGARPEDVAVRLARRLIERQGGRLVRAGGRTELTLPAEEPTRLRA